MSKHKSHPIYLRKILLIVICYFYLYILHISIFIFKVVILDVLINYRLLLSFILLKIIMVKIKKTWLHMKICDELCYVSFTVESFSFSLYLL